MKTKFISLLTALVMALSPTLALAEDAPAEQAPQAEQTEQAEQADEPSANGEIELTPYQQKRLVYNMAHTIADSYYYGVSDTNLLFSIICATIENDGVFDVDLALKAMLDNTGDEYAEFYPADAFEEEIEYYGAAFYGLGVVLEPQDGGVVVNSVYTGGSGEEAGLKVGDRIMTVDGVDVSDMLPADVREMIVGEENTAVELTVLRGEQIIPIHAVRRRVTESHSSMEIIDNKIAYITVDSFTGSLPDDFDKYIDELVSAGINDVIIDLRDNGGGDLNAAISVAKKLIPSGLIGTLKEYKDGVVEENIYSENLNAPRFDTLVLVNENTASASEFLAMALQSRGRAKLMGTHTYGKGCMQSLIRTANGSGLKFTTGEYFSPKGERIHTVGLTPDLPVENTKVPIDEASFLMFDFNQLGSETSRMAAEQRLNALGLLEDEDTDGVFDAKTEVGLRIFQAYCEFEPTGELDLNTALKLTDFEYDDIFKIIDDQYAAALAYFDK